MASIELRFPDAYCLGAVYVRPRNTASSLPGETSANLELEVVTHEDREGWRYLARATGTISVEADQAVRLVIAPWGQPMWEPRPLVPLPPMEELIQALPDIDPSNIEELDLHGFRELPISETEIAVLCHFVHLRWLNMADRELPAGGFTRIARSLPHLIDLRTRWASGLEDVHSLRTLYLYGDDFQDADVAALSSLKNLTTLYLSGSQLTGSCLRHLTRLENLEKVRLGVPISDETAPLLSSLTNLKSLYLGSQQVSNSLLPYLAPLTKLESFRLFSESTSDKGVQELCRHCRQLRELTLSSHNISSDGLSEFSHLSHLRILNLYGTNITEAGLRHLHTLGNLREMSLNGAPVQVEDPTIWSGLPNLQMLNLGQTQVTDASDWSGLPNLRTLKLANTQVRDGALQGIGKHLPYLETLDLSKTSVGGTGFVYLRGLEYLKNLYLGFTPISIAGLEAVGQLQNLERLILEGSAINGKALAPLSRLTNLKALAISESSKMNKGLQLLSPLRGLTTLSLPYNGITAKGMKSIASFDQLESLVLRGNKITDDGIPYFKKLSRLRYLNLTYNPMSIAGLNDLYLAMPETEVFY